MQRLAGISHKKEFKKVVAIFLSEAVKLSEKRNEIQRKHPGDPKIMQLNLDINKLVQNQKHKKWIEFVQTLTHRGNCSKLWSTVKRLSSSNAKPPANRALYFDAKKTTPRHDPRTCVNKFNQQYTPYPTKNENQKRNTLSTIRKLEIEGRMFKCNTVKEAVRATKKSKALVSDRIAPIHLYHLGPIALRYLTDTITLSVNSAKNFEHWKDGLITPLHKPGKPIDESYGFMPIALLSSIAKLTEKLLLSDFIEYPLKEHQHGIRPEHSTSTALSIVTNNIQKGLNQKKPCNRTLLVSLDLTAAFHTVDHNLLLRNILEAPIPNSTRWVASYLQGRFS